MHALGADWSSASMLLCSHMSQANDVAYFGSDVRHACELEGDDARHIRVSLMYIMSPYSPVDQPDLSFRVCS